jgi:molybdopterin synthase catalytic subunit
MVNNQFSFVQGPIAYTSLGVWMKEMSEDHHIGAHSIFAGQVRSDIQYGKQVKYIEYTAYEEMALTVGCDICREIAKKYDLLQIKVLHSLGNVSAGELSLLVMVAGRHRKEPLEACREIVERIKKDLPVWGKEWLEDEGSEWKINT